MNKRNKVYEIFVLSDMLFIREHIGTHTLEYKFPRSPGDLVSVVADRNNMFDVAVGHSSAFVEQGRGHLEGQ